MSNLLEQASLVMIPSGYKEDVVYSEIPLDGSGDLSFTRASSGTRINSQGLVEVCPWNLFGNSEDGTSGKWGNPFNISSVTLNSTTAPNGTNTGNLVVENSANSNHWFEQSFSAINGTPYTISIYFKAKERTQCAFYAFTDNFVFAGQVVIFNLSTGAIVSQSGTQTNSIENVGNGWYRCAMTVTANASATAYFGYGLANGGNQSYQGDGTSGLYMWGRQLNTGTLKPYFPTTDRLNVPRLTYQNGGGGCPSLLLEKQSTNLVTYSEQFDNADWQKQNTSVTANATTSPDGTQNADKLIANTTNARHLIYQGVFVTNTHTFTTYAKAGENSFLIMRLDTDSPEVKTWFNLSNGTIGTSQGGSPTITSVGNGWYRCSVQYVSSTTQTLYAVLYTAQTDGGVNFAGNGTDGTYVWGAQLEDSSYPTSYIPTTSSSATRVADDCFKTGISSLIGQTEGVMFADFVWEGSTTGGADYPLSIYASSYSDFVGLNTYENTNSMYVYVGGSNVVAIAGTTFVNGQRYKIAMAYKSNDFVYYLNGTQMGADTSGSVPSSMANFQTVTPFAGKSTSQKYNEIILFPTRLTNAELASLTTI